MQPLVLYDTTSKLPGAQWSSNPAKPRFVLSYKGLPFVTVWIEYSEIGATLKPIGAKPLRRRDGSYAYTVPTLSDPNTGSLITDSIEIASYLEKTYPEKPIFPGPNHSEGLIRAFDSAYNELLRPGMKFILGRSAEILSPDNAKFFMDTRCRNFNLPWDEFTSEGQKRDAEWALLEKGYSIVYEWYQKSHGRWIMGDTFSYADIIVASELLWYKRVGRRERVQLGSILAWALIVIDLPSMATISMIGTPRR